MPVGVDRRPQPGEDLRHGLGFVQDDGSIWHYVGDRDANNPEWVQVHGNLRAKDSGVGGPAIWAVGQDGAGATQHEPGGDVLEQPVDLGDERGMGVEGARPDVSASGYGPRAPIGTTTTPSSRVYP